MNSAKFSIRSRLKSFKYALAGIKSLIRNEHNSRIHLTAAIAAILTGIILNISFTEWAIIIVVIGVVFIIELLNSSIESLADLIDPKQNDFIKRAKDYGAAAVLISAIIAIAAGVFIFIPRLLHLILR
jgi:diacylglycerol kinase (ATP)